MNLHLSLKPPADWKRFFSGIALYLLSLHHSFSPDPFSSPFPWKASPQRDAAITMLPPCFPVGVVLGLFHTRCFPWCPKTIQFSLFWPENLLPPAVWWPPNVFSFFSPLDLLWRHSGVCCMTSDSLDRFESFVFVKSLINAKQVVR